MIYITNLLMIFLISMLPVVELRGGIPYGALQGIPVWLAALVAVLGNSIPVPLVMFGMDKLLELFGHTKLLGPILKRFVARAEEKAKTFSQYEFWGMLIFVGIPLPGTGAWTGAMISSILKIPPKKALPAIIGGCVMSAAIMCIISYALPDLFVALFN